MNMLRGAASFLVILVVFAFAQCKHEETENSQSTAAGTAANRIASQSTSPAALKPQCGELHNQDDVDCPETGPCEVPVELRGNSVHVPKTVWVYDGQEVTWKPSSTAVTFDELHFSAKDHPGKPKGDKKDKKGRTVPLAAGDCTDTTCVKTVDDAADCTAYKYTLVVRKQHGPPDAIDPEIEVGSSSGTTTMPTSTTSTSSTSVPHG
jgi:hypothetical protein